MNVLDIKGKRVADKETEGKQLERLHNDNLGDSWQFESSA